VYNIILYQIVLSCIIGAIIGFIARKVLRFAEEKRYRPFLHIPRQSLISVYSLIDHESFLSFGVALTFFTLGIVGILGSDDILCCFVVGNSFTWDDWFRVQTEDHAFQDVIDQLLSTVSLEDVSRRRRSCLHARELSVDNGLTEEVGHVLVYRRYLAVEPIR